MDNIKKYPKSKHNMQCLGPCYYPETTVIHPTHLEYITDGPDPFCPVEEWYFENEKTGQKSSKITDICHNPTKKNAESSTQLDLNILTPYIDFNYEQFLKLYYKIFSFSDALNWIESNKHTPINTQIRIINCSLKSFGDSVELFDVRFSDFFADFIKKKEIRYIYDKIHNNIEIKSSTKEIYLVSDTNLSKRDNYTERTNYIIQKFIIDTEIIKFLQKYLNHKDKPMRDTDDNLYEMLLSFTQYILNKIKITLKQ